MICRKCAAEIPNGSATCPACGADVKTAQGDRQPIDFTEAGNFEPFTSKKIINSRTIFKRMTAAALVVVVLFAGALIIRGSSTRSKLMGKWYSYGANTRTVLDFGISRLDYYMEYADGRYFAPRGSFKWEPMGDDRIQLTTVHDLSVIYSFSVSEDGKTVTFKPAITASQAEETWVRDD